MRLFRCLVRRSNIGLSHRLRLRLDVKISNTSLKSESYTQWRGRSFSASAQPNAAVVKKAHRRVSKDERRAMVENYVNNYTTTNAGKFPTASNAVRAVGGSYYFVRQILQELIHKAKMPPTDAGDKTSPGEGSMKRDKVSAPVSSSESRSGSKESKLSADNTLSCQTAEEVEEEVKEEKQTAKNRWIIKNLVREGESYPVHAENSSNERLEPKEEPQTSIRRENLKDEVQQSDQVSDKSEDVGSQTQWPSDESQSSLHSDAENSTKKETISEDKVKVDRLKPEAETQQSSESEASERELHKEPPEVAELQTKTSVWQNLKSFASSLFGSWKR